MKDRRRRTLLVQTEHDMLTCAVLGIQRNVYADAWVVLVDSPDWLDADYYAECRLRNGRGRQSRVWHGSYTILEHIVAPEQGFFYTKGLFYPADADPNRSADGVRARARVS